MMSSRRLMTLLLAVALLISVAPQAALGADVQKLLVLYGAIEGTQARDSLSVLRRQMVYAGREADFRCAQDDVPLDGYTGVIVCMDESDAIGMGLLTQLLLSELPVFIVGQGGVGQLAGEDGCAYAKGSIVVRCVTESDGSSDTLVRGDGLTLLTGESTELGGNVFVGTEAYPLCQRVGSITHMAYFDASTPALCTTLATQIASWLWPYEGSPVSYGFYLVVDQVYPFTDLNRMMALTDMLFEEEAPFALSVMPLYSNGEFPAMKRFCEYLRYVQSKGAGIILRAPLVSLGQVDASELLSHIEISYEALSQYGVYPLAFEAPVEYALCEKGLEAMVGFRTVFLFDAAITVPDAEADHNVSYRHGHQIVAPAYNDVNVYTSSYAQAIYLDPTQSVDELRAYVKRLKSSKRVFKSLRQTESTVYMGSDYVYNGALGMQVNGKLADLSYEPFEYDEDYEFDRGFAQYMTNQIETSNQLILLFVGIACAGFLLMIYLSRRTIRSQLLKGQYRRRDEYPRDEARADEEREARKE